MRARRLGMTVVLALAGVLVTASAALAQADVVYGGPAGTDGQLGEVGSGSSLPFTGLNLALIVLGGLVLIGTGLALRFRRTSGDHQ